VAADLAALAAVRHDRRSAPVDDRRIRRDGDDRLVCDPPERGELALGPAPAGEPSCEPAGDAARRDPRGKPEQRVTGSAGDVHRVQRPTCKPYEQAGPEPTERTREDDDGQPQRGNSSAIVLVPVAERQVEREQREPSDSDGNDQPAARIFEVPRDRAAHVDWSYGRRCAGDVPTVPQLQTAGALARDPVRRSLRSEPPPRSRRRP
jgi:hypothetical protein